MAETDSYEDVRLGLTEALLTMGRLRHTMRMRGIRVIPDHDLLQVQEAISQAYNALLAAE